MGWVRQRLRQARRTPAHRGLWFQLWFSRRLLRMLTTRTQPRPGHNGQRLRALNKKHLHRTWATICQGSHCTAAVMLRTIHTSTFNASSLGPSRRPRVTGDEGFLRLLRCYVDTLRWDPGRSHGHLGERSTAHDTRRIAQVPNRPNITTLTPANTRRVSPSLLLTRTHLHSCLNVCLRKWCQYQRRGPAGCDWQRSQGCGSTTVFGIAYMFWVSYLAWLILFLSLYIASN